MTRVWIAAAAALVLSACATTPPTGARYHVLNGGCVASPTPMPATPSPTENPGGELG